MVFLSMANNYYLNSYRATVTLFLLSVLSLASLAKERITADEVDTIKSAISNNHSIDAPSVQWEFLKDYSAIYQVYYDDDLVGSANERLTFNSGFWRLEMNAKLKKLFFKVNSNEYSEFLLDEQILYTQRFHSKTEITFKKDKVIEQFFDWSNKIETGLYKKRSWQLPLEQQVFDRMSHTIQLRQELINRKKSNNNKNFDKIPMEYSVSHKGKRESYIYKSLGIINLSTPNGNYQTIKLERTKKNGDKFLIWLSPKLNYFPVKISQKEEGKSEVSFIINKLNFF
jgi:hypothetical protein